ncbi:MAG: right-handed parallel beta-helix repeat-containing protein, partial [Myxococcales bacterium]|nr:right-handed parallel beta-helix repeat-containing protein [Myxococcales bacterium]
RVGTSQPVLFSGTDLMVAGPGSMDLGLYGDSTLTNVVVDGATVASDGDDVFDTVTVSGCTGTTGLALGGSGTRSLVDVSVTGCSDEGLRIGPNVQLTTFTGVDLQSNGGTALTAPADLLAMMGGELTVSGNGFDGVQIAGGTSLRRSGTWPDVTVMVPSELVAGFGSTNPVLTIPSDLVFASGSRFRVGTSSNATVDFTGASLTGASAGDWLGLEVGFAGSSTLTDSTIENATTGLTSSGGLVGLTRVSLLSNTVAGLSASGFNNRVSIAESLFQGNGDGLRMLSTPVSFATSDNQFTGQTGFGAVVVGEALVPIGNSNSTFSGNVGGGVHITGGAATNLVLADNGQAYVLTGTLSISGTSSISADIDVNPGGGIVQTSGSLMIADSVITSSAFPASPGDWLGITFGPSCTDATTSITNSVVSYGGGNGFGNLYLNGCDATVTGNTIFHSSTYGIYVNGASPVVSGNSFANNASGDTFP